MTIREALRAILLRLDHVGSMSEEAFLAFNESPAALKWADEIAGYLTLLDVAVTGKCYLRNRAEDVQKILDGVVQGSAYEVYLSDGGYSRFVVHSPLEAVAVGRPVHVHTDPALMSGKAKARWDAEGLPYRVELKDL